MGPIIGGAFNDSSATWRWAFYINLCIAGLASPIYLFLIPSIKPESSWSVSRRLRRIDYLGALLFAGGITCVLMMLGFGGVIWPWTSGRMITVYVCAGVLLILFVIQQASSFLAVERLFPVELVKDWEMCIFFMFAAIALGNTILTIWTLPLFFQFIYGYTALRSGYYILAVASSAIAAVALAGVLLPRFPMYMPWFAIATAVMVTGSALLSTISSTTHRSTICGFAALHLFGCGFITQLPFAAAQIKAGKAATRSVTGFLVCAQALGSSLSISITSSIFMNLSTTRVARLLPDVPRAVVQASIAGAGTNLVTNLQPELRAEVLGVIADTIASLFYLNVASAGIGFIISMFMKKERLNFER
jgi:hypothetical protein